MPILAVTPSVRKPLRKSEILLPHGVPWDAVDRTVIAMKQDVVRAIGPAAYRVWQALASQAKPDMTTAANVSQLSRLASAKGDRIGYERTRAALAKLREVGLADTVRVDLRERRDPLTGQYTYKSIHHRRVNGVPAYRMHEGEIAFLPPTVTLTSRNWGGARKGAGRKPKQQPYSPRIKFPEGCTEKVRQEIIDYFRPIDEARDAERRRRARERYRRRKAREQAREMAGFFGQKHYTRGRPLGRNINQVMQESRKSRSAVIDLYINKKDQNTVFFPEGKKTGGVPSDPAFFDRLAPGGKKPPVQFGSYELTPLPTSRPPLKFAPPSSPVPDQKGLAHPDSGQQGVRASIKMDPAPGGNVRYDPDLGYVLGTPGLPNLATAPRWGVGCLPPMPTPDIVPPAIIPKPPKLPNDLDDDEAVEWIMRAYRGACEYRWRSPCKVFLRWGSIRRSKFYKPLLAMVKEFRERDISPGGWIAFSIDEWRGFGKDKDAKGKPVFPPIPWLFSTKRLEEQEQWFLSDEHLYQSDTQQYGVIGKQFLQIVGQMQAMLISRLYDGRTEQEVFDRCFPNGSYDKLVEKVKEESAALQELIDARLRSGEWLSW
jgi:hypothetical protein